MAAARPTPDRGISAGGARGAAAGGLAHFGFANRVADTNDHGDGIQLLRLSRKSFLDPATHFVVDVAIEPPAGTCRSGDSLRRPFIAG